MAEIPNGEKARVLREMMDAFNFKAFVILGVDSEHCVCGISDPGDSRLPRHGMQAVHGHDCLVAMMVARMLDENPRIETKLSMIRLEGLLEKLFPKMKGGE